MTIVDVLMPLRSPSPWLCESLDGLREQSDIAWRLVVVIHGPGDDLIADIGRADVDAEIVHAPANLQFPEVLNVGLSCCRSPFVARVDGDDVALPTRLSATVEHLVEHPEYSMVATRARLIDARGVFIRETTKLDNGAGLDRALRWKNVIVHSSVTMRRQAVVEVGGYRKDAQLVEDYDLWLRLRARNEIALLPAPLVKYRVHARQSSRRNAIPPKGIEAVRESRLALARAQSESLMAARIRQDVWASRQLLRRAYKAIGTGFDSI